MTDKELQDIKSMYEDYIRFEGAIHGGTGSGLTNCYSYQDGHDNFCEWLIDGFGGFVSYADQLQSELTAYKSTDLTPSEIKSLLSYGECGESIIGHCNMSGIVADLKTENTRLKVELDKAVEDLKQHATCWVCKNQSGLFTCELTEKCGKELKHWEYRGLGDK